MIYIQFVDFLTVQFQGEVFQNHYLPDKVLSRFLQKHNNNEITH